MRLTLSFLLIILIMISSQSILLEVQAEESIDFGYAIKNITFNERQQVTHPNGTITQRIDFKFSLAHWNPTSERIWFRLISEGGRLNFTYHIDPIEFELNSGLELSLYIYDMVSLHWSQPLSSGEGVTEYFSAFNAYLFLVNYTRQGSLPWGEYRFDLNPICIVSDEKSEKCLENKLIKYSGGTILNTLNGTNFEMDNRPANWGDINEENTSYIFYYYSTYSIIAWVGIVFVRKKSTISQI